MSHPRFRFALASLLALAACGDKDADDTGSGPGDVADADGDGVPDDEDLCAGDDATGDTDGDAVCDDVDLCAGDDATGDTDGDAVCDDLDLCAGDDATGDTDGDAVCDDLDVCAGDDATGDTDGDLLCDDTDACPEEAPTVDDDGDGCEDPPDVAVFTAGGVWAWDGAAWAQTGTGAGTRGTGVGDVDGDGDLDVSLASAYNSDQYLCLNDGANAFSCSLLGSSYRGTDTAMGDWDADGDVDIMLSGSREVCLNDGTGAFSCTYTANGNRYEFRAKVADFDGDGLDDVAFDRVYTDDPEPEVALSNGDGTFTGSDLVVAPFRGHALGDFDEDGDIDILTGGVTGDPAFCANDGSGAFSCTVISGHTTDAELWGYDIESADFDGDGHLDFMGGDGQETCYGDGSGTTFTCVTNHTGFSVSFFQNRGGNAVGDFDRDGDTDWVNGGGFVCWNDGSRAMTCDSSLFDVAAISGNTTNACDVVY